MLVTGRRIAFFTLPRMKKNEVPHGFREKVLSASGVANWHMIWSPRRSTGVIAARGYDVHARLEGFFSVVDATGHTSSAGGMNQLGE